MSQIEKWVIRTFLIEPLSLKFLWASEPSKEIPKNQSLNFKISNLFIFEIRCEIIKPMNTAIFPENLNGIEGWYYHINQDFSVDFRENCALFPANIWIGPFKNFQAAKKESLKDLENKVESIRDSIKVVRLLTEAEVLPRDRLS